MSTRLPFPYWRRPRSDIRDDGIVIILFALLLVAFLIITAFAIDLGNQRQKRRQAQATADAAALAAAHELRDANDPNRLVDAIRAAKDYAQKNFGIVESEWVTCQDSSPLPYQPPGERCISFDSATTPRKVRVYLPTRTFQTFFGNFAGQSTLSVSAVATARVGAPCVFCVLNQSGTPLSAVGRPTIQVRDSRGDAAAGSVVNGSANIGNATFSSDGGIGIVGTAEKQPNGTYNPTPTTGISPIPDPLQEMPVPTSLDAPLVWGDVTCRSSCTLLPGRYGNIKGTGNGTLVLTSGVYIITGSLEFTGNLTLKAENVLLFFTCGTAASPAPCSTGASRNPIMDLGGTDDFEISGMETGPWQGVAIFVDRNLGGAIILHGTPGQGLSGTFYARSAHVDMEGTADLVSDSLFVTGSFTANGDNRFVINYSQERNYQGDLGPPRLVD